MGGSSSTAQVTRGSKISDGTKKVSHLRTEHHNSSPIAWTCSMRGISGHLSSSSNNDVKWTQDLAIVQSRATARSCRLGRKAWCNH